MHKNKREKPHYLLIMWKIRKVSGIIRAGPVDKSVDYVDYRSYVLPTRTPIYNMNYQIFLERCFA